MGDGTTSGAFLFLTILNTPNMEKPFLVPKELYKALQINGTSRARGFVEDYLDGAHDLYVMLTHQGLLKQSQGLTESDLTPKVDGWVSVETGIPENTKVVLCKPVKGTMFVGFYTKGHEIEFQDEDYEGEYDEVEDRNGTLYLKPGWYEEEEQAMSAFDSFYIKREVTHWQPLPSAPLGEVKQ